MTRTIVGAFREEDIVDDRGAQSPRSADAIAGALREAREYTLAMYAHLTDGQQRFPMLATVNPPRWEIGHVGWFQELWCRRHRSDAPPAPSRLANSDEWFDSSAVPHDTRWDLPLPDWPAIHAYLDATLDDTLSALRRTHDGERYFFELALYHEDMHAEALLMSLQTLALPAPSHRPARADAKAAEGDAAVAGGTFRLGAEREDVARRFVFDNEKFAHEIDVAPFAIGRRCVNEGEFAAFVDDDGYRRLEFWSEEGRRWLRGVERRSPAYWRRAEGGDWEVRQFDRWRPLERSRTVEHVNAFEAEAWCAWAGRRLPTEAEWEKAARDRLLGVRDVVWEWTATPFRPYPGFAADPYQDYSAPWFDDHRVLRGRSWATQPRLAHDRFRNFYRPERHDVIAGFRTCQVS